MKTFIWVFLTFALISVPARADKWATGTYHTGKPLDQVFDQTVKMIETKRWYITRVRSQIQSINREQRTVHATYIVFGEEWGDIYVSMATQENATSIKAIVRLRSDATLHAANYAHSFGNELKKLFPDLTFEIKRDVIPENFALVVSGILCKR